MGWPAMMGAETLCAVMLSSPARSIRHQTVVAEPANRCQPGAGPSHHNYGAITESETLIVDDAPQPLVAFLRRSTLRQLADAAVSHACAGLLRQAQRALRSRRRSANTLFLWRHPTSADVGLAWSDHLQHDRRRSARSFAALHSTSSIKASSPRAVFHTRMTSTWVGRSR